MVYHHFPLSFPSFPIVSHIFLYFHPYFPICSHSFPYVGHNWRVLASSGLAEHFFSGRGMDRRCSGLSQNGGFPMSGAEFFVEKWGVWQFDHQFLRVTLFEDPISKRWWITLAEGFLYVVNFEPDMRIRHHFCNYFFSYKNQGRMGELTYRSGKQGLEDDFTSRHFLQCVFDLTLLWVKIAYPKVDSWSVFLTETCKLLWVIGSHW